MVNVGDLINDKYRVTRMLGKGGMGFVVEAHHAALDMLVAIKFMRAEAVAQIGGTERFLREARSLVKLKSQHAVKVHDIGVHDNMPFIVMEHLEGTDMQALLDKNGPISPADAARQLRQACEAISEAHSLGIYHRDLKPANFFLARGASGRLIVKVLDFGIAKIMKPEGENFAGKRSLTGPGMIMGTMHYMSPEQLLSPKDIDARSDIWSIGVVFYVLVTGQLPFGTDPAEIPGNIRFEPPRPWPLHPTVAQVIHKCLEKNKENRYQSAVELAIALRPLIQESLSPFGSGPARLEPAMPATIGSPTQKPAGDNLPVAAGNAPTMSAPQGLTSPPGAAPVAPSALEFAPTVREPPIFTRTLRSSGEPPPTERVSNAHDTPTLITVERPPTAKSTPPPPVRIETKSPPPIETKSPPPIETKSPPRNLVPIVALLSVAVGVVIAIVFFLFAR